MLKLIFPISLKNLACKLMSLLTYLHTSYLLHNQVFFLILSTCSLNLFVDAGLRRSFGTVPVTTENVRHPVKVGAPTACGRTAWPVLYINQQNAIMLLDHVMVSGCHVAIHCSDPPRCTHVTWRSFFSVLRTQVDEIYKPC